jgi:hypothetical protein
MLYIPVMDPNSNLQEQERILHSLSLDGLTLALADSRTRNRMAELREALHDWLVGGGFEPDWSKAPRAAKYYKR